MAFDRPTYDESWHRVADTRPRLRPTVQAVRQTFRGRTWHVLLDPGNNQHFRVSAAGHRFVGMLDGRRTVQDVWEAVGNQLGDEAPTQGEALKLLGQLHTSNLLDRDLPPDARRMFERRQKRVRKEVGGYFKNILFARVPIWDPDRFLNRWSPAVDWVFGPVGVVLWVVLIGVGVWSVLGRGDELWSQGGNVLSPANLPWLYACFVGIKALHELGHAFACKRFGRQRHGRGEVHTVGIMLMVLTPVPYVDATSAWALPSKWQRAFVGAAGMYAELAVAAAAAVVWSQTAEGTLAHGLAYNLIFIAGVSTILFNANPLIKFDGYYILSDLIEMPNLNQRSTRYLTYLVRRYVYGVRQLLNPAHLRSEKLVFVVYGLAALAYRIFLGVVIVMFVADKLFFVGALLAIMAVVGYVVVPASKLLHYVTASAEPARVRGRAVLATLAMAGVPVALLALVPVPDRPRASGVLEARQRVVVHAEAGGKLTHLAPTGAAVAAGDVLFRAESPQLEARVRELEARQQALRMRYQQAITGEPSEQQVLIRQIAATQEMLDRARQDRDALTAHAPFAGVWTADLDDDVRGHHLQRGDTVGVLRRVGDPVVRVAADQFEGPRLAAADDRVEVRLAGRPDTHFRGRVVEALPAGQRRLPSAALGQPAGGPIAVDPADTEGRLAVEPFFAFRVDPVGADPLDATGRPITAYRLADHQRLVVRFELPPRPLLSQWVRRARQALQQRFQVPADPDAPILEGLAL
ncbi:MAG: PqqD family peptide modification chaperone [Planctomycetota bacterium]